MPRELQVRKVLIFDSVSSIKSGEFLEVSDTVRQYLRTMGFLFSFFLS